MMDHAPPPESVTWREALGRLLFPWRGLVGLPFLLACLWMCKPQVYFLSYAWWGWPILLLGLAIRSWGVAGWYRPGQSTQTNSLITEEGPYPYTRNPRYLGNLLLGLAGCTLASLPQCYPAYCLLWSGLHLPIVWAEEAALERHFGQEYLDYQQRVPRFLGSIQAGKSLREQLLAPPWRLALLAEASTIVGWLILGLILCWWRLRFS